MPGPFRHPVLQRFSHLDREIAEILRAEYFENWPAGADPNKFLLLVNVLSHAAHSKTASWQWRPQFFMPRNSWVFFIRTMPSCITRIKLNNLLVDADALLLALVSSSNSSKLKSLKIRQSLLTVEGFNHLKSQPALLFFAFWMLPFVRSLEPFS